jgi:ABC-type multidrug transport system fused ATPase/permease subunit
MLSQLSESLAGHSTIRAFQETDRFIKTNGARMNMLSRAYMLQTAEHVWLGIRLENIGGLLVLAVALMCTVGPKNLSPNAVALSLSYMVSIAGMLSATVDVATYLENASKFESSVLCSELTSQ